MQQINLTNLGTHANVHEGKNKQKGGKTAAAVAQY